MECSEVGGYGATREESGVLRHGASLVSSSSSLSRRAASLEVAALAWCGARFMCASLERKER